MDDQRRALLARALLGNGMAGQSADMLKLSQAYDQMAMEGQSLPPKGQWIQQQLQQQSQPPQPVQQPMQGMQPMIPNQKY